jgi:uncharacterized membrane protein
MKVFGHPLHMVLIHFPSALFPMDLACSIIAWCGGPSSLLHAAFYATLGGVALGWLAIITGAIDLVPVVKHHTGSINKALIHGGINTSVVIVFSVIALMANKKYPDLSNDSLALLITKTITVLAMFIGNYLGGSLVLKDRIGSHTNHPHV